MTTDTRRGATEFTENTEVVLHTLTVFSVNSVASCLRNCFS